MPQKSTTYYYFAAWRDDGTDQVIHELLRCQVRERARRLEDPTPVVLDTQRVHAAAGVPAATTGPEDLPEHPDYPRILAVFNEATGRLRAKDVCEALDHELLPKNVEGTRAKLKRLVKLGVLAEVDTGSFARKQ
ncbi:hypothetical protein [Streptomyces sp. NEAU-174]|uniref:hypothetical protein n=1 Tax=Streptomyces sp. NEAU-174 TaxID=3458254 RepID=UPI0040449DB1